MTRKRHVEYWVHAGSGHYGPRVFTDRDEAIAKAQEEAAVPSYIREGAFQSVDLIKVTTITERVPFK